MKDMDRPIEKEPVEYSPAFILQEIIDPSKIIRNIVKEKLRQIYAKSGYQANEEAMEIFAKDDAEKMMQHSTKIIRLRQIATKILEKDHILVDSHLEHVANRMKQRLLFLIREWLEKNKGAVVKIGCPQEPKESINLIKNKLNEQIEFIKNNDLEEAKEIHVYVDTHSASINTKNDNGYAQLKIDKNGKIISLEISEMFSYTIFENDKKSLSIYLLAKNFPDQIIEKFEYGKNAYSSGSSEDTKINLSTHLHDFGEYQFWINIFPTEQATNEDVLDVIQLWLELLKKYPRIPKNKS